MLLFWAYISVVCVVLLPFFIVNAVRLIQQDVNPIPYTIALARCFFVIWFFCIQCLLREPRPWDTYENGDPLPFGQSESFYRCLAIPLSG